MGWTKYQLAAHYARQMCDCVGACAVQAGLVCGRVTAVRHEARVTNLKVAVYGQQLQPVGCGAIQTPCGCSLAGSLYDLLYPTVCARLQPCAVRYGNIKFFFQQGVLHDVTVTESFRFPNEIPYLSRVFLPWFDSAPPSFFIGGGQPFKPK